MEWRKGESILFSLSPSFSPHPADGIRCSDLSMNIPPLPSISPHHFHPHLAVFFSPSPVYRAERLRVWYACMSGWVDISFLFLCVLHVCMFVNLLIGSYILLFSPFLSLSLSRLIDSFMGYFFHEVCCVCGFMSVTPYLP